MNKKLEEEYLKNNSRYNIEREILSTMEKNDLKSLIDDKLEEEKFYKENIVWYLKKLYTSTKYNTLKELEKIFFEWIVYIKAGWKLLEDTKQVIKHLMYLYDLKFTHKNINSQKNENYVSREVIEAVKQIKLEYIVLKYSSSKINNKNALKCPLHNDNRASFQIYSKTNSFYCYWCGIWWTSIEFVSKLFNLSNTEAIKKLQKDFYILNN